MGNMMAKEVPQFLMGANGLMGYESNGRQIRLISEINQIAAIGTPFAILPGDGSTTGLQFTGSAGAFTLSAAILTNAWNALKGCWC